MTGWKIDPAAVRSVLDATRGDAEGFEGVKAKVAEAVGGGVAAAPDTETAATLQSLADDPFGLDIEACAGRVSAAVGAVSQALAAYEQGDGLMADQILTAQTEAG